MIYDVVVIGSGLFGSCSARRLAEKGLTVCLIGAKELATSSDVLMYSSHADAGRVTLLHSKDDIWRELCLKSAVLGLETEQKTYEKIFHKFGCLVAASTDDDPFLQPVASIGSNPHQYLSGAHSIQAAEGRYNLPNIRNGVLESSPSGALSPLALIRAQRALLKDIGGACINDVVLHVGKVKQGTTFASWCAKGDLILSHRVLVAGGPYTNFNNLLPFELDLQLKSENVLLCEVSEETTKKYANLPSLIWQVDNDQYEGVYMIGPLKYPNGRFYFKLGANLPLDHIIETQQELNRWLCGESRTFNTDNEAKRILMHIFTTICPRVDVINFEVRRCVLTRASSKLPYIGRVCEGMYVCTGGNGYGAMTAEACGVLAATLIAENRFLAPFEEEDFKPVIKYRHRM